MELLEHRPGMNKHQLSKKIGIHPNAVDFHLHRLIQNDLVETRRAKGNREILCFTPDNVKIWDDVPTRILLGRGPARKVASFLINNPGTSSTQVSTALGIPPTTVRRHLRTLEESGLIQRVRVDRNVFIYTESLLSEWMENMKTCDHLDFREFEAEAPPSFK